VRRAEGRAEAAQNPRAGASRRRAGVSCLRSFEENFIDDTNCSADSFRTLSPRPAGSDFALSGDEENVSCMCNHEAFVKNFG
jgi:hypothetical protein